METHEKKGAARHSASALKFEFAMRRVCVRIDRTEAGNEPACSLTTECIESGAAGTASLVGS